MHCEVASAQALTSGERTPVLAGAKNIKNIWDDVFEQTRASLLDHSLLRRNPR